MLSLGFALVIIISEIEITVPKFSATLGFQGEIRVPLNGDHSTIVKYASKTDNNYRVVSRTLAGLIQDARNKEQHRVEMYVDT
jgi:hypothetical protein